MYPLFHNTKIRADKRLPKNTTMKSQSVSPSNIRIRRLINHVLFVLMKHDFIPRMNADGSTSFRRRNSQWAVIMEANDESLLIRPDCKGPIMIGGTFVEEFLRSGLFTLDFDEGQCVIASINPKAAPLTE